MREPLSTKLNRLAEAARKDPKRQFRTIAHLISVELLEQSFRALRRNAASGIDGVTFQEYEQHLKENLIDLHSRMKEMRYRAQPLRRVHIPKGDGKERPLSIPVLEDKIAQRAAVGILSRIYENDFLPCSYGYRKGRRADDALGAIQRDITLGKVNYVLEADIQDYFGSIVRDKLMEMLRQRVAEKNFLRLIGKWLHVGVLEEGRLLVNEKGIHQGSVISPLLANVYLHEVLDRWFEYKVKPRLRGDGKLYRFADDFIACFEHREDAERVHAALHQRFEAYGLKLHVKKTKLIKFGRQAWREERATGRKPETFDFLGFTHYCGTSRKGKFVVKVRTMKKRLSRSLKAVKEWCKRNRHRSLAEQRQRLGMILRGHYAYYGRRSNFKGLWKFYQRVIGLWRKALSRRTRNGYVTWDRLVQILSRYPLPRPCITRGDTQGTLAFFGEPI